LEIDMATKANKQTAVAPTAAPQANANANADANKEGLQRYKVLGMLHHDGEAYEEGSEVELTEKQAAPLLGHTVVAVGAESAAESQE
jgi:hypothetical protein